MNNSALEAKLRRIRVPERAEEYWDDFPSQVRMKLAKLARQEPVRCHVGAQWQWNGGLALAGVLLFFSLLPVFQTALKDGRILRQQAERLPQGMHVLMADEHGLQNLILGSE